MTAHSAWMDRLALSSTGATTATEYWRPWPSDTEASWDRSVGITARPACLDGAPCIGKAISVLRTLETDDRPRPAPAGLADALDAVVAVLEHELVAAVGEDHGRQLGAFLDERLHRIDTFVPEVLVDLAQDRLAGRAGKAMYPVDREQHWARPPLQFVAELLAQQRVVAPRTGEEPSYPLRKFVALGRSAGSVDGVLVTTGHRVSIPAPRNAGLSDT